MNSTMHSTNWEARKQLEKVFGKEAVMKFVKSHGRRIVIIDAYQENETWMVSWVPQLSIKPFTRTIPFPRDMNYVAIMFKCP